MATSLSIPSPALYQVTATSTQKVHPSGLRSWLVTIRVTISGQECQLGHSILGHNVISIRPELQVTYLRQVDMYWAVYAVEELRQINQLLDLPITIMVIPKYHPSHPPCTSWTPNWQSLWAGTTLPPLSALSPLSIPMQKHISYMQRKASSVTTLSSRSLAVWG